MEWPLAGNRLAPPRIAGLPGVVLALRRAATVAPPVLLGGLAALYVLLVGSLAVARHTHFETHAYDLGIYDQALWLISRGELPFVSIRGLHILGDHFTPILYLLALLYRVGMGVEALLWTQTVALALGAWPLYRIGARQSGSPWVGLLCAGTYLLYPPLRAINLFDFHPISLAVPGLLFALAFAFERRAVPMLLACLWSVLCKQEVAVVVACIAIWYAVRWRQPKALALTAFGLLWFVVATRVMAHYAGTSESAYIELYSQYGNTTGEVLRTFVLTPWIPLARLARYESWSYLLLLLVPLALLPLRSPGILWLCAFPLALNLFSSRGDMLSWWGHSVALLIPPLCAAAAMTVGQLPPERLRVLAAAAGAGVGLVSGTALKPPAQQQACQPARSVQEARADATALAVIPPGATVSASNNVLPHLSGRRVAYLFPNPFAQRVNGPGRRAVTEQRVDEAPRPDWEALRRALAEAEVEYLAIGYRLPAGNRFPLSRAHWARAVAEALCSPAYGLIADSGGVWVLRRGADHAAGLRRVGLRPDGPLCAYEAVVPDALSGDPAPRAERRQDR